MFVQPEKPPFLREHLSYFGKGHIGLIQQSPAAVGHDA